MKRLTLCPVVVCLALIVGCAPSVSPEQIQSTVVAPVTAQTTPTDVPRPSATPTAAPTATSAATATPRATATPKAPKMLDEAQLLKSLTALLAKLDETSIAIIDVRYEDGAKGPRTILHVEAKHTGEVYDANAAGSVVGLLAGFLSQKPALEPDLFAFNIIMRDAKLNPKQTVAGTWQDLVDFSAGRLTDEQFVTRLLITP